MHYNGFSDRIKGFFVRFVTSFKVNFQDGFATTEIGNKLVNTVNHLHDMILFLLRKLYLTDSEFFDMLCQRIQLFNSSLAIRASRTVHFFCV